MVTEKKSSPFQAWWKVEGKIQVALGAVVLLLLVFFHGNLLAEGCLGVFVSMCGFVTAWHRKSSRILFLIISGYVLCQGALTILRYFYTMR